MKFLRGIEIIFTFFCVGFTAVVLAQHLLGRELDIRDGILAGVALAVGRGVRVLTDHLKETKAREVVRG